MRPAVLLPFSALLVAAGALATLVHCGGVTSVRNPADGGPPTGDATSSGPDALGGDDSGTSATDAPTGCGFSCPAEAGPPLVVCPTTPPTVGTSCSLPSEECEYGSSWWLGCDQVFACVQGTWQVRNVGQSCFDQDAAGSCPATWAEAAADDAGAFLCPATECQYPDGYCVCLTNCGGGGQRRLDLTGRWYCSPATPGCPTPRPDLGTSCDQDGATCQYGQPCGCGEQLQCVGSVWQGYPLPPCP